jgi:excisionase family DNA binding protein
MLLGLGEAARRLGVYPDTLRRWTNNGKVPCVRDSAGRRLISDEDIDKLARERKERTKKGARG